MKGKKIKRKACLLENFASFNFETLEHNDTALMACISITILTVSNYNINID